jgi:hypothetical protein
LDFFLAKGWETANLNGQVVEPYRRLPFFPSFFRALNERPGALVAFFFFGGWPTL